VQLSVGIITLQFQVFKEQMILKSLGDLEFNAIVVYGKVECALIIMFKTCQDIGSHHTLRRCDYPYRYAIFFPCRMITASIGPTVTPTRLISRLCLPLLEIDIDDSQMVYVIQLGNALLSPLFCYGITSLVGPAGEMHTFIFDVVIVYSSGRHLEAI
jgi:hypothetical protein